MPHSSAGPEDPNEDSDEHSPKPLEEQLAASRHRPGGRIDPATFEVRLRRWALLLLVAVPAAWFVVQQLR